MTADIREPLYQWGQEVVAAVDLVNDGTFPDVAPEMVLAASGDTGIVVRTGVVEETGEPIYLIEFQSGRVVGALESEIQLKKD